MKKRFESIQKTVLVSGRELERQIKKNQIKNTGEIQMKNLLFTALILTAVLLACGCVSQGNDYSAADSSVPVSGKDLMPLDVVINIASDNSTQTFYSIVKSGSTAFDALDKIAEVEATDGEYGKFITSINGVSQDESHYWMFFVDNKLASVGSSSYVLESGDEIEFKLMDSQEASALMGY